MPPKNHRKKRHILLVEDDHYCAFFLKEIIKLDDVKITSVGKGGEAYDLAAETDFDLIMVNLDVLSQKELLPIHLHC